MPSSIDLSKGGRSEIYDLRFTIYAPIPSLPIRHIGPIRPIHPIPMTSTQLELYRMALLRVLEANETQYGLSAPVLAVHVATFGFRGLGADFAAGELRYLEDKGFVRPPPKAISPENQTWRITAAGRDWLAQNG